MSMIFFLNQLLRVSNLGVGPLEATSALRRRKRCKHMRGGLKDMILGNHFSSQYLSNIDIDLLPFNTYK